MATLQLVDLASPDGLRMLPTTSQRKRKASPMAIGAARKHYVHLQASRDQWSQRRDDQTPWRRTRQAILCRLCPTARSNHEQRSSTRNARQPCHDCVHERHRQRQRRGRRRLRRRARRSLGSSFIRHRCSQLPPGCWNQHRSVPSMWSHVHRTSPSVARLRSCRCRGAWRTQTTRCLRHAASRGGGIEWWRPNRCRSGPKPAAVRKTAPSLGFGVKILKRRQR